MQNFNISKQFPFIFVLFFSSCMCFVVIIKLFIWQIKILFFQQQFSFRKTVICYFLGLWLLAAILILKILFCWKEKINFCFFFLPRTSMKSKVRMTENYKKKIPYKDSKQIKFFFFFLKNGEGMAKKKRKLWNKVLNHICLVSLQIKPIIWGLHSKTNIHDIFYIKMNVCWFVCMFVCVHFIDD